MYVCLCKSVTDRDIRRMVTVHGVTTMRQLRDEAGVSTQCGRCAKCAREVLQEALSECGAAPACPGLAAA
jgi:bacterioferritin-associated ferredoxin